MSLRKLTLITSIVAATAVSTSTLPETEMGQKTKKAVSVLLASENQPLAETRDEKTLKILHGLSEEAEKPRPNNKVNADIDAFQNVYDFLIKNTNKNSKMNFLNNGRTKTFDYDGVHYVITLDMVSGENVFCIEWTSNKMNKKNKKIEGKWIFRGSSDGTIRFTDTLQGTTTLQRDKFIEKLSKFKI